MYDTHLCFCLHFVKQISDPMGPKTLWVWVQSKNIGKTLMTNRAARKNGILITKNNGSLHFNMKLSFRCGWWVNNNNDKNNKRAQEHQRWKPNAKCKLSTSIQYSDIIIIIISFQHKWHIDNLTYCMSLPWTTIYNWDYIVFGSGTNKTK